MKTFSLGIAGLATGAALMLNAPCAMAHDPQVNWSVSVGTPYYAPPAVLIQPQPVYVAPVPVMRYRTVYYTPYGRPYYVETVPYGHFKHKHRKHHHH